MGVAGKYLVKLDAGPGEQTLEIGKLPPSHSTGAAESSRSNARLPGSQPGIAGWWWARFMLPGGPSAVSSRSARQIGRPTWIGLEDKIGALQLASLKQPDLEPDAALGAFLAGPWHRVQEEDVTRDHADPIEAERIRSTPRTYTGGHGFHKPVFPPPPAAYGPILPSQAA